MIHLQHNISSDLAKYVHTIHYNKDYYPDHEMDKYLPDGTINIIFELTNNPKFIFDNETHLKRQECKSVWFSGVLKDYITISSSCEEMMVIVFKPGAGFPLVHKPASLFTNKVIQAEEIFGNSILKLLDELKKPSEPETKFGEIEKWLKKQLKEDDFYTDIIQKSIHEIENLAIEVNIKEIAEKSGFSQKQFIQIFKKYVGITPKQLHRIKRFNEILSAIENNDKISWTKIAIDCGYFDQAHFIKDFYSFSGLNPSQYLHEIGEFQNYIPVK